MFYNPSVIPFISYCSVINNIIFVRSSDDNTKGENDESKCDNCHDREFRYCCKDRNERLCIECNNNINERGSKACHERIEVSSCVKKAKSLSCKVYHGQEMRWFCKTCRHSVCDKCVDLNGAHEHHDFILCSTMVNNFKIEVNNKYIEIAESKKEPIISALDTLEAILFDIGVEGVKTFTKTNNHDNTKHVTSLERAKNEVRAHYAAIRHLAIEMEEIHLRQIEMLAKAKSDGVMSHIKALHADLDQIDNCCDAKEAMIASPALEACASHSDVMALLNDLEAHMASIKITIDSCIQVTVLTSDVLRVLEKSCHVGGPSTPGEVLIEVAENQSGFVVSWNISKVDECKSEVSSYVVEVTIVREGENETEYEDIPHKYTVLASTSSSPSPASDSDRLRLEIKDKAFVGQTVFAMVTATDVNGACSGKGVSASVVLPSVPSWSFMVDIRENLAVNWMDGNGNIMFHFNPRSHQGQIVMNTYINRWGREERIGLDVSSIQTRADIQVTDSSFEVLINGVLKHSYAHRLPWNTFDHISDIPASWKLISSTA